MADGKKDLYDKKKEEQTDNEKIQEKLKDDINKANSKAKSNTSPPPGPNMLGGMPNMADFFEDVARNIAFGEILRNKPENTIEQTFKIKMPYSQTCELYMQTKSGFVCVNNAEDLTVAESMLRSIGHRIVSAEPAAETNEHPNISPENTTPAVKQGFFDKKK